LSLLVLAVTALAQDKPPAITDPAKADADFAVLGEYVGELNGEDGKPVKFGVQVVALGNGRFRALGYKGGLPGDGWDKGKKIEAEGQTKDDATSFPKFMGGVTIKAGMLTVSGTSGDKLGTLKRIVRQSATAGVKPPEGAIVLFDGSGSDKFTGGKLTEDK